ncbi:DAO-domain-containing protein [Macroventuria anomochaeta]|uniref:DAO-domain-containing protein n=1 Tax=Macroventuria anomochaeta TaxID=301207 RepID=A0ACB6SAD7_9PLEO|nr:DAO-domain-containing protein [Macroventuria anomochaeta]KAF2630550.1 DAO-domain-containing protein [Macroventuria anomochaeta]
MVFPTANPTKCYWIENAESPLRNFRSSDELPAETDVAIIGSGYAGASTAYWIHKYTEKASKQPQVTLLEARDICGGATGRNGGQLRPHAYSRYPAWSKRFGPDGAMGLIAHEMAHLSAFRDLADAEGIAEEVCLKFGETFDAAMTDEAWTRLKGAFQAMQKDHGDENDIVKACRLIEDAREAEEFSQMKGALAAVVHPTGQIWAYKFVHALLRIVLQKGNLNLQANTPVTGVSERDADGWVTVKTERGTIRARTVVHTTNRWAAHLLPEFNKLILPMRGTVAAIKAPPGFIKHTGAQHWDNTVNNYHLQLPPPYNTIMIGGARQLLVHRPKECMLNDEDDQEIAGVAEFFKSWPASDVTDWPGLSLAELSNKVDRSGCWTGIETSSADSFPFVGPVPARNGHYIAAGFAGHGMPRILLSAAHITPLVLESLNVEYSQPLLAASFPPLPQPFQVTAERVERLQNTNIAAIAESYKQSCEESAKKPFCNTERAILKL